MLTLHSRHRRSTSGFTVQGIHIEGGFWLVQGAPKSPGTVGAGLTKLGHNLASSTRTGRYAQLCDVQSSRNK
jgi:hypothetical protein